MKLHKYLLVILVLMSSQLYALEAGIDLPYLQQSLPTSLERKSYNLNISAGTKNTALQYQIDNNTGQVTGSNIDDSEYTASSFRISAGAGLGVELGLGPMIYSVKYQFYGEAYEKMQQDDWAWSVSLIKYNLEDNTSSDEQVFYDDSGSFFCIFLGICATGYYPAYSYDAKTKVDELNVTGGVKISSASMLYGSLAYQDIKLTLDYQDIKHDVTYVKSESYNVISASFGYYRKFNKTFNLQAEISGKAGDTDIGLHNSLLTTLGLVITF